MTRLKNNTKNCTRGTLFTFLQRNILEEKFQHQQLDSETISKTTFKVKQVEIKNGTPRFKNLNAPIVPINLVLKENYNNNELFLYSAFLDYSIQCACLILHNLKTTHAIFLLVIGKVKEMSF